MNDEFKIILMSPSLLEEISNEAFSPLLPGTAALARAILTTLQNRHIGITPRLSAELARLVKEPQSYKQSPGCWGPVMTRLLEECSEGVRSAGVMLNATPLYSVIRLAAPVVEEACNRLGLCFLFCRDEVDNDATLEEYRQYESLLENEIRRMAQNKRDYFRTFWKDRALTLASYSRRAPIKGRSGLRLAEVEPSALSLLLRLNPVLPAAKALPLHPKTMVDPMKHREIRRMREGGFSGIHVSRRMEDMGDILLSEFLNPPAVLADRLINNGYLALRRQTKREQLRDVLIVGMLPSGVQPQPSSDFIKACWFDFIARFAFMLYRSRLMRSEFRWLQGDNFGRVRSCNFILKELPDLDIPVEGDLTPEFRREFLLALGWLPRYLDTRGRYEKVPLFSAASQQLEVTGEHGTGPERQWAYSAWRAQRENSMWSLFEPEDSLTASPGKGEKRLDIGGYAFVHVMLFLPAEKRHDRGTSPAARLGPLYSGLGLGSPGSAGNGHQYGASITWVPERLAASDRWAFDCRGKRRSNLFSQQETSLSSHSIAGRLEEAWRQQLLKELQNG
jgi:hypothetical protein